MIVNWLLKMVEDFLSVLPVSIPTKPLQAVSLDYHYLRADAEPGMVKPHCN